MSSQYSLFMGQLVRVVLLAAVCGARLAYGQPDHSPPQLVSLSVVPPEVDVSSQAAEIRIEVGLKDDITGVAPTGQRVSYWAIELTSPSAQQARVVFNADLRLMRGTALDGVWVGVVRMPQYSEPGVWKVSKIHVRDGAGNALTANPPDIQALNLNGNCTVVSSQPDMTPPQFKGLAFAPPSISMSGAARSVSVTVSAKDDLSGLTFLPDGKNGPSEGGGVVVTSPSGKQTLTANPFSAWTLVSGTPQDGTWQANLTFRGLAEAGAWKVTQVCLRDAVRNIRCYGSEVSALGAPDLIVTP